MDSITQMVLGATVAGAVAGKKCNGNVLLAGGILGTLPDLDVFIDYGNDLANTVNHRGFSHSLLVLVPLSLALTMILNCWQRLAEHWRFWHLFSLICLSLTTHPLLDSFTSYGTQLWWPLNQPSVMIGSIFIIDLFYTVPLIIACIVAWRRGVEGYRSCCWGLLIASGYLLWSLCAQQWIVNRVEQTVAGTALEGRPLWVTPTLFNTVLWRIVVMDEGERYWEGVSSLLDADTRVELVAYHSDLPPQQRLPGLAQFQRFAHNFVRYDDDNGWLKVSDLRMGMAGATPFGFYFATRGRDGGWQSIPPSRAKRADYTMDRLPLLWQRLLGDQSISPSLKRDTLSLSVD